MMGISVNDLMDCNDNIRKEGFRDCEGNNLFALEWIKDGFIGCIWGDVLDVIRNQNEVFLLEDINFQSVPDVQGFCYRLWFLASYFGFTH